MSAGQPEARSDAGIVAIKGLKEVAGAALVMGWGLVKVVFQPGFSMLTSDDRAGGYRNEAHLAYAWQILRIFAPAVIWGLGSIDPSNPLTVAAGRITTAGVVDLFLMMGYSLGRSKQLKTQ